MGNHQLKSAGPITADWADLMLGDNTERKARTGPLAQKGGFGWGWCGEAKGSDLDVNSEGG